MFFERFPTFFESFGCFSAFCCICAHSQGELALFIGKKYERPCGLYVDVLEGIFPNEESNMRLIGADLYEQNDKWQTDSQYMMAEVFDEIDARGPIPSSQSRTWPTDLDLRPSRNFHHIDGRDLPTFAAGAFDIRFSTR
ncbi:hypothetical protein QUB73_27755 (plasmid) [Roseibium aggregatum]|nr:hypothetical protein [Roseibium aggregatum]WJS05890.1 hypothetical protein QUB73_27755 [Roseibium aggregatum]